MNAGFLIQKITSKFGTKLSLSLKRRLKARRRNWVEEIWYNPEMDDVGLLMSSKNICSFIGFGLGEDTPLGKKEGRDARQRMYQCLSNVGWHYVGEVN